MTSALLTLLSLASSALFPWPFTAFFALLAALGEPLAPLAAGIFTDALYYSPAAGTPPIFTLAGGVVTLIAYFVRSRLRTGII